MTSGGLQEYSFREHSDGTQRILKEHSESNQREREQSDFVIPLESKYSVLSLIDKINFVSGLSANKWVRFDDDVLTSNNLVAPFNLCHFSNLFVDHNYKIIFSFHII